MTLKERYKTNKAAQNGTSCKCPGCGGIFIKKRKPQAFCTSKSGTVCKDKYWNLVTPTKRNNTTRISPANAAYYEEHILPYRSFENEHPFSSEALGQN